MATITFDTLKFVEGLKAGGVPEAQAKAEAEALGLLFLKQWIRSWQQNQTLIVWSANCLLLNGW